MMKDLKLLHVVACSFVLLAVSIVGCVSSRIDAQTVNVDCYALDKTLNLTSFLNPSKVLALSGSTESGLLRGIDRMLSVKDKYYVVDNYGDNLVMYDASGQCEKATFFLRGMLQTNTSHARMLQRMVKGYS